MLPSRKLLSVQGFLPVLMLGTIALTARSEKRPERYSLVPLAVVLLTGGVLIYGTLDMPNFGAADAPVQQHVGPDYIRKTPEDIDVPNIVTAVLASYRGFDTLGEVTDVFTAGLGCCPSDKRTGETYPLDAGRGRTDGPSPHLARGDETARRSHPALRALCSIPR